MSMGLRVFIDKIMEMQVKACHTSADSNFFNIPCYRPAVTSYMKSLSLPNKMVDPLWNNPPWAQLVNARSNQGTGAAGPHTLEQRTKLRQLASLLVNVGSAGTASSMNMY